jgi:hypothetical protein
MLEAGFPSGWGVGNPMPPLPFLAEKAYYQEEPMTDPLLILDEGTFTSAPTWMRHSA